MPSNNAVIQSDNVALIIDVSLASSAIHKAVGLVAIDLTDTPAAWTIQTAAYGLGIYSLRTPENRLVFSRFDDFIEALNQELAAGLMIGRIHSRDLHEAEQKLSTVRRLSVYLVR